MVKIGLIGGSGLDNPDILKEAKDIEVETLYGKPSSPLKTGRINDIDVVLIARHGREHTIPPTQVNFRANIHALKDQGCTHILATTAVGSLRQEIERGDLVIINQFIDFTRHRNITFKDSFEPHKPEHTPMAEPFDSQLRNILVNSCKELELKHHSAGTVITIEGPRFSTKAESHMFRSWGADVINMSVAPEAALANEAGIPYAAIAMSTDYDCWKEDEEPVTWEAVLGIFKENVSKVTSLLVNTIPKINSSAGVSPPEQLASQSDASRPERSEVEGLDRPHTSTDLPHTSTPPNRIELIKSKIKTYPDWPKEGIMFRDINSLLNDPEGLKLLTAELVNRYKDTDIDIIAGIESRGFITGSLLAHQLKKKFVLIRKPGKLPGETISQEYTLEYGTDKVEIQKEAIKPGDKVLLSDDLCATGGTALASAQLIKKLGGEIVECSFVIDLPEVGGKQKLLDNGLNVFSLVDFEGE